ncbi:MAG TPA: GNAT family N-acetyltransferase [Candidatus Acidoferrales bacterium]|nr:GNAT family N-acetyltransferase [Candidatus Acidoferrales bacterium]
MSTPSRGKGTAPLTIRPCHGLAEFEACYKLQRVVWGNSDIDVPTPMFVVAAETGGQVIGAWLDEDTSPEKMVGFVMAIAGWRDSRPFLHSHMAAVLESFRDRGIGRALKFAQREDALARGIDLVEWTFDPLEVKNAYFNLMRLGAIARRYLPNLYGLTTSPLHGGLPTDRLVAEWWLRSPRVAKIVRTAAVAGAPAAKSSDELLRHAELTSENASILVPAELARAKSESPRDALRMQSEVREQFLKWFSLGYVATRIEINPEGARYTLEPPGATAQLWRK